MPASPSNGVDATPDHRLSHALGDLLRRPHALLIEGWNWKSASVSALIRGTIFLSANLKAGGHSALRAMLVESVFAIFAAGVLGGITQRLRNTRPIAATAVVIWLLLPACMVSAEATLHHLFRTPHVRAGLISSFVMAAISSGFSWFAQRRGVLLAGPKHSSIAQDLRKIPSLIVDFLLAGPQTLLRG